MVVVREDDWAYETEGLVATVGFFDGVHLGHRFLIGEMRNLAKERGLPSAVITFPIHPRTVLQADYQPKLLNSFEEKTQNLSTTGIDYCILMNFTPERSHLTAKEFIESILADKLKVRTLLIGYDHRFGHNRTDGFEQYVEYGKTCGIEIVKVSRYDDSNISVSSSEIRKLLAGSHVEQATSLLGYPYRLKGHIISGHKIGRTLGFPTANIQVDESFKVIPGIGIYAVKAELLGSQYKGMLYIGDRPTLNNGKDISLEVNIFDFDQDIYNENITIHFIAFIREDMKFGSLDELKAQLGKDRMKSIKTLD